MHQGVTPTFATLYPLHHPEPPCGQRHAVTADGGVLPWRVLCPPDGAAVALGHAVAKFRNPKRIPRHAKAAQHVAMLVAGLGSGKRWRSERRHARVHNGRDGKFRAGVGVSVAPVEHHAAFANAISRAVLQPTLLPRAKQADDHVRRLTIGQINAEVIHPLISQKFRQTGAPLCLK